MKKLLFIIHILCVISTVTAQTGRDFFTMALGDSLVIFLTEQPKALEGFLVYRQGPLPTTKPFELRTITPVVPVKDPQEMLSILGDDWYLVSQATETEDPFEALRKLQGSAFAGGLLSLLSTSVAQVTGRSFIDRGVEKGKEYNYKIVFVDVRIRPKDSLTKKITIKEVKPQPPTKLQAKAGDKTITLNWSYPVWNGNYEDLALQFKIYRKHGSSPYEVINTKPIIRDDAAPREYTDTFLEENVTYTYYITAVDPIGRESAPSEPVSLLLKDITPPSSPQNLIAEAGDGVIGLSWNISLELDAAGYNIYRSTGLDKKYERLNKFLIPLERPFYFDSTVATGVQYFYSVSAVDKAQNESKMSNPVTAVSEDHTPPDPPSNISYKLEKRFLKLSWNAPKAKDVAGYHIYRGESYEIQPRLTEFPLKTISYIDSGYRKEGLTPGKTFIISITAVDRAGNESKKTTTQIPIPDDEPPLPPQNFYAVNREGQFVEISCGSSSSIDVRLYKIYKVELTKQAQELVSFSSTPFTFRDTAVKKGMRFIYYAVAVDSANNKSRSSKIDTIFVRDFTPPPSSRNVRATLTDKGVLLEWERVVDFDFVGYNIYRAEIPTGVYEKLNTQPVKELRYLDNHGKKHHYYKVRSVDSSGNESTRNEPVQARQ